MHGSANAVLDIPKSKLRPVSLCSGAVLGTHSRLMARNGLPLRPWPPVLASCSCFSARGGGQIRGWKVVSAAGLQGKGSAKRSVFTQTPACLHQTRRRRAQALAPKPGTPCTHRIPASRSLRHAPFSASRGRRPRRPPCSPSGGPGSAAGSAAGSPAGFTAASPAASPAASQDCLWRPAWLPGSGWIPGCLAGWRASRRIR